MGQCWPSCTHSKGFSREVVRATSAFIGECCVLGPGMYVDYNVLMHSLAHYMLTRTTCSSDRRQVASAAELRLLIKFCAMPHVVKFQSRFSPFAQPWPPRNGVFMVIDDDNFTFVTGIALKDGRVPVSEGVVAYSRRVVDADVNRAPTHPPS